MLYATRFNKVHGTDQLSFCITLLGGINGNDEALFRYHSSIVLDSNLTLISWKRQSEL